MSLKSRFVSHYYCTIGIVPVNLNNPHLVYAVEGALHHIRHETDIQAKDPRLVLPHVRDNVYRALIDWCATIEDPASYPQYGDRRTAMFQEGADLGDVIAAKAAVCRELSMFGHIVMAELGIRTNVSAGSFEGDESNRNTHVWLNTAGKKRTLDFNYFRSVFSYTQYPGILYKEQVLVIPN